MSSTSPSVVFYSSDGYELAVVPGAAITAGTRSLLISGSDPNGNAHLVPSSSVGVLGTAQMSNDVPVQTGSTITASGSALVTTSYFGTQEIALVVNVGTVTGAGSIQYTIQEIDPGDGITVYGNSAATIAITSGNTPNVFSAALNTTTSSKVKVSWAVVGAFSATIYTTIICKTTPSTQAISGTVSTTNNSVGADGAIALGFDTQIGGKVTTSAPSYTNGNLNAISLTTLGGLRIDGVYAAGTSAVVATTTMISGGYVTAVAPTYTNATANALSLTTAGALRVDGSAVTQPVSGTITANQGTTPWIVAGNGTAGSPASGTITVQGISGMTPISVVTNKAATSAVTSVGQSTSSTVILSSNANRVFASIYNNSGQKMLIKLGTAASASSYSVQVMPNSYWEIPNNWTGEIDAVWSSNGSGNALVTELTT